MSKQYLQDSKRYLAVEVYRNTLGDSTNNGISSEKHNNRLAVPCKHGNWSEEEAITAGFELLELGCKGGVNNFIPKGSKRWNMNGGNFAYSSDSRFSETYGNAPVAIHDRVE